MASSSAAHPELKKATLGMLLFSSSKSKTEDRMHKAGYGYHLVSKTVPGLTIDTARAPSAQLKVSLKKAVDELQAQGATGIAGESCLMWPLQAFLTAYATVPVFTSSLVQIALLVPAHHAEQKFLIVSKFADRIEKDLAGVLASHGMDFEASRFICIGVEAGKVVNPDELAARITKAVADDKQVAGAILDCGDIVQNADRLRAATSFPVFDQVTCLDYFVSASSDNPYFGTSYVEGGLAEGLVTKARRSLMSPVQEYNTQMKSKVDKSAKLGVLRIDYNYPPIPGDVACDASYGYKVVFAKVSGLTFEKAQAAAFDDDIKSSFEQAVQELTSQDVAVITGDCGFMMAYQTYVRSITPTPVVLSSILQAPIMSISHSQDAVFALLTANSDTLDKEMLLTQSGVKVDIAKWVVVGLQDVPGFEAVALGQQVPAEKVQPAIAEMCKDLKGKHPTLAGFLLECTELPHYADEIRAKTGLPVFDAITLVDYFQHSCTAEVGFSQKMLANAVGVLDPRTTAAGIATITAGTLGSVRAVAVTALAEGKRKSSYACAIS